MSLKEKAEIVLEVIANGYYHADDRKIDIKAELESSISGSKLYTPVQLDQLRECSNPGQPILLEVINGTTQLVAQTMATGSTVALLNFASARNPCGGFLNGAKAQEEDLCRCSTLYSTLTEHPTYYQSNRKNSSLLYTDHAIYSPAVPFFKTRGTGSFLPTPFFSDVITMPAPNTKPYLANSGKKISLQECFLRRWKNVLAIAKETGNKNLLLGAWGCGAFGGDPVMAARTAKEAMSNYGGFFDRIVFAIPGTGKRSKLNLTAFAKTLDTNVSFLDVE